MFTQRSSRLPDEMCHNINVGTPKCFAITREPNLDNALMLYTQKRMIPVNRLAIYLRSSPDTVFLYSEQNFQGLLLLDQLGQAPFTARFSFLEKSGEVLAASDYDRYCGKILILADTSISPDPVKLLGIHAIFTIKNAEATSSMIWNDNPLVIQHWSLEIEQMQQGENYYG